MYAASSYLEEIFNKKKRMINQHKYKYNSQINATSTSRISNIMQCSLKLPSIKIALDVNSSPAKRVKINEQVTKRSPKTGKNNDSILYPCHSGNIAISNENQFIVVKRGNNSELIKSILLLRPNWNETEGGALNKKYNFKWMNSNKGSHYCLLNQDIHPRMINHFEFEAEISNKKLMFVNFLEHCEAQNINAFNYIPFTILIKEKSKDFTQNLDSFCHIFQDVQKYITTSAKDGKNIPYSDMFKSDLINLHCKVNCVEIADSHYTGKNLWILKPPDLCQGKCIKILNYKSNVHKAIRNFFKGVELNFLQSLQEVDESVDDLQHPASPVNKVILLPYFQDPSIEIKKIPKYRTSTVIVQKYIENPFLYNGRKFDIRIWVLINHNLDVFIFKEGHLKTASFDYSIDSKDKFVHITNYSFQKHAGGNFEKYEEGNEVSFQEFQKYLYTSFPEKRYNLKNDLYPQMRDIVKISTMSIGKKINRKDRKFCFVILGYDFMIDVDFKVWLIEVNKNPGFSESSAVIKILVRRMLDDAFKLTIDDVFKSTGKNKNRSFNNNICSTMFPVEGYSDEENMFEYLQNIK